MNISTVDETMSPQVFYILLALTDKTLHGYGIREQVAYDSEGNVVMATGTVYILLKKLVSRGLVRKVAAYDENPRISCRYELTNIGARQLNVEVGRLETITRRARYKLAAKSRFST